MPRRLSISEGQKFGRLTAVDVSRSADWKVQFVCDCGKPVRLSPSKVIRGHTLSCGCLRKDSFRSVITTHGKSGSGAHRSWKDMMQRCHNPSNQDYGDYGGKGITVCAEWRNSFEQFHADMGDRPSGASIDRIDGSKGYSKDNCRWADKWTQASNRKTTHFRQYKGEELPLMEIARRANVPYSSLRRNVVERNMEIESAIAQAALMIGKAGQRLKAMS